MARKKNLRIQEALSLSEIVKNEASTPTDLIDKLAKKQDFILEIGCGKGRYTLALAEKNPDHNLIGIDKKIYRLWFGAKAAAAKKLSNVLFLNRAAEELPQLFPRPEVREIWITFPDPYPKDRHEKRRLINPDFLKIYARILTPNGLLHLKTDNLALFNYAKDSVRLSDWKLKIATTDLYRETNLSAIKEEALIIQTDYEQRYLAEGKAICYLCCQPKTKQATTSLQN